MPKAKKGQNGVIKQLRATWNRAATADKHFPVELLLRIKTRGSKNPKRQKPGPGNNGKKNHPWFEP